MQPLPNRKLKNENQKRERHLYSNLQTPGRHCLHGLCPIVERGRHILPRNTRKERLKMISSKSPTTRKERNPNRNQNAARVSIAWDVYDRLDTLAIAENASITEVVRGLLDMMEQNK